MIDSADASTSTVLLTNGITARPAATSRPSGESVRTASSRISPRSSAVLNSTAISCAVRLPCGRSQRYDPSVIPM